jgi:hypothetical protein
LYNQLLVLQPDNLVVLLDKARLAARRSDRSVLQDAVTRLEGAAGNWPAAAIEQYRTLQRTGTGSSFPDAARAVAIIRNVLLRDQAFRSDLAAVKTPTELIAEPFDRFLRLPAPSPMPSPPDTALSFVAEPASNAPGASSTTLIAFSPDGTRLPMMFPSPTARSLVAFDWNRDFRMDLAAAGPDGLRLLEQKDDGTFADLTSAAGLADVKGDGVGVWAADIEMDGDIDLIVGVASRAPIVLRNNGDGTWGRLSLFTSVVGLRAFTWGDVDGDGDPDAAMVDEQGVLHVFENRQGGTFSELPKPSSVDRVLALALADIDGDGSLDLITLDAGGKLRRSSMRAGGRWDQQQLASWDGQIDATRGEYRLFAADLDNNGALDLVASGAGQSRIWLAADRSTLQMLPSPPPMDVFSIVDLNGDGQLDLAGLSQGQPTRMLGRGTKGYHWQVIRPRAQQTAGDQRINSFGVGGEIEIRSGLLTEKQVLTGEPVHFGLGARTTIDVARILWPNGVLQVDFDTHADQAVVAEQRLKGSCPWVFTDDGTGMRFVTDFLWRSPLGLRINAQETAGVTQTEDWVKIRGDQLAPKNGLYDVRITAELWETHFVDHVSLMSIDHPSDVDVFVDERFANEAPHLAVHAMSQPRAVARAWDESGRDVTGFIAQRDGRYLNTFALGAFQGVAENHVVEFELGRDIPADKRLWLVANGWIYPTDSSINVAIGQGHHPPPHGLSLEAEDSSGRWIVVAPDLGFPAGKNKTILIDLSQVARAGVTRPQRLRLKTNLEIYWDWLAVADDMPSTVLRTTKALPSVADLRFRGFSETHVARRDAPETPTYSRMANMTERWRDLIGYYTRFGDVRELLAKVDDRYVIMNAGDELRLLFPAGPPLSKGWTRDFVLIGDGWVKDGDYNTSFSKTVEPLPAHDLPEYQPPASDIESDPVYRRHPEDWQTFHTRFVAPNRFLRGLR